MNDHESEVLKQIVKYISENPLDWVLILGSEVACTKREELEKWKKNRMMELFQEQDEEKIIEALGEGNIDDLLFGNVWDGVSFLDKNEEKQADRRRKYAEKMATREKINVENMPELKKLLNVFPRAVLTTCLDETVEALMEYEISMPVKNQVFTPYKMMTLPRWEKWEKALLDQSDGCDMEIVSGNIEKNSRVLIKLYGNCRRPHKMLLSKSDRDLYYPGVVSDEKSTIPQKFLEDLFRNKNLLIVGTSYNNEYLFTKGIDDALEKIYDPEQPKRYIFLENGYEEEKLEKKHLTPVSYDGELKSVLKEFLKKIDFSILHKKCSGKQNTQESSPDLQRKMNDEEARKLFRNLYTRRFWDKISENELNIIDKYIFCQNGSNSIWSWGSIYMLSVIANNLSDFYDLRKVFDKIKPEKEEDFASVCTAVLEERVYRQLGKKGRELCEMIEYYNSGFPLRFLELLSENETKLREWRMAGTRLINSGLCRQRNHRKSIQSRVEYADCLMQTAAENSDIKDIKNVVRQVRHEPGNSYLYKSDIRFDSEGLLTDSKKKQMMKKMFCNLRDILKNRREGYDSIYSLLDKELPVIIEKIHDLEDSNFEWKAELLYYLFSESRIMPVDISKVNAMLEELLEETEKHLQTNKKTVPWICRKVMILQTFGNLCMFAETIEEQEQALRKYEEAEKYLETYTAETELSEDVFERKLSIYFQKSKIYGRISTIEEVRRCGKKKSPSAIQDSALTKMKDNLECASELIKKRVTILGNLCDRFMAEWDSLQGEYEFKRSQYHWEIRKYGNDSGEKCETYSSCDPERFRDEKSNYEESEKCYINAMSYYKKFPHQYEMQMADLMRKMADLYCWKSKSLEYLEEKEKLEIKKKSYDCLIEAYKLYRRYGDLHGIANVLQSVGNNEKDSPIGDEGHRSASCFYRAANSLYKYLNDGWSQYVISGFYKDEFSDKLDTQQAASTAAYNK